jgi:uncharacterized protein YjbI with pentapeptide repeats
MTVAEERRPERLGPYRLRERLGEGGMGVVYLATDPAERLVAVKVLRRGVPGETTARRRLAREFDTMRRVHSPFVAEVIDADVNCDPPYIVTRYVPGRTVEELVDQDGPMTGLALLRLARGLAAALTAVHAAGVVHRDLKPANVMIVDGSPVVIDFGIAQAPDSTRLTLTGMFMGTPGYLAPEVIEGSPSGPAADVHSWATTVAFAATGRPPFGSGAFEAIFYRIVNGQPDLTSMPTPLVPLVLHALARDPSRRPAAAELADRAGCLDPAALLPGPPRGYRSPGGALAGGAMVGGPAPGTVGDLPARQVLAGSPGLAAALPTVPPALPLAPAGPGAGGAGLGGAGLGGAGLGGAGLGGAGLGGAGLGGAGLGGAGLGGAGAGGWGAAWPNGTRELSRGSPGDYSDLLPPVNYGPSPGSYGPSPGSYGPPPPGGAVAPFDPGAPPQPWRSPADPASARSARRPADQPRSARRPLVLAVIATAIAASVLLPIGGTVAVLVLLVALRSADLISTRLQRRRSRQGRRTADPVAVTAFLPLAIVRSLIRLLLMLPLALVFAGAAAAVTFVAVPGHPLARAAANAAGGLVASYFLGPGSGGYRRPLSTFFGAVTGSTASAIVVFVGMAALAVGVLAAALSLPPFFWPAGHLSLQFHHVTVIHGVIVHPRLSWTQLAKRLGLWPFG